MGSHWDNKKHEKKLEEVLEEVLENGSFKGPLGTESKDPNKIKSKLRKLAEEEGKKLKHLKVTSSGSHGNRVSVTATTEELPPKEKQNKPDALRLLWQSEIGDEIAEVESYILEDNSKNNLGDIEKAILLEESLDILGGNGEEENIFKKVEKDEHSFVGLTEDELKKVHRYYQYLTDSQKHHNISEKELEEIKEITKKLNLEMSEKPIRKQFVRRFYDFAEKKKKDRQLRMKKKEEKIKKAYEKLMDKSRKSKNEVKTIPINIMSEKTGLSKSEIRESLKNLREKGEKLKIGKRPDINFKKKNKEKIFEEILKEFPNASLYQQRVKELKKEVKKTEEEMKRAKNQGNREKYEEAKEKLQRAFQAIDEKIRGPLANKEKKGVIEELEKVSKQVEEQLKAGIKPEDKEKRMEKKIDQRRKMDNIKEATRKEEKLKKLQPREEKLENIRKEMEKTEGKGNYLQRFLQEEKIPIATKDLWTTFPETKGTSKTQKGGGDKFPETKGLGEKYRGKGEAGEKEEIRVTEKAKKEKEYQNSIRKVKENLKRGNKKKAKEEATHAFNILKKLKGKEKTTKEIPKRRLKSLEEKIEEKHKKRKKRRRR